MKKPIALIIVAVCIITYLLGMFLIPLMDVDAAQYASISREMLLHKNFLQLYDLGNDPNEENNLAGSALENDLAAMLREAMKSVVAPEEQFVRLGFA